MNKKLFRVAAVLLCGMLSALPAEAQKWQGALRRLTQVRAEAVSASIQRQAAFARESHFAARTYLFSAAETARIRQTLREQKHLSEKQIQHLLLTRPGTLAKEFSVPAVQKNKAVFLTDFSSLQVSFVRHLPDYPVQLYPGDMARGMVLRQPAQDLHEIFSKGLLASRCGIDAWTQKRLIFMVNTPSIAARYARANEPGLPVIVHISGFDGKSNHMTETEQDIPPSQIVRVSALVNLNGHLTWGQITPAADGFLFHPYRTSIPAKAQSAALRLLYPNEK